jgi:hypothetical protein
MRKILRDAISLKLHDALFPRPGPEPEPEPEPDILLIQPVFNYFNYVIAHSCLNFEGNNYQPLSSSLFFLTFFFTIMHAFALLKVIFGCIIGIIF